MFENVIEIKGNESGPISVVLAGTHGNEKCGVEALERILPNLVIKRGTVFFAYGNPRAIEAHKRFIDSNLNRLFRDKNLLSTAEKASYEYRRAQFLKKYLNRAGALLDIHASSIPKSKSFIVSGANAKGVIEYLPADLVVSGFDKIEPGGTDYYMNKKGKVGICLECGNFEDVQSTKVAEKGIFAFLKAIGHIENDLIPRKQSYVKMYKKYVAKTDNFILSMLFGNFETVRKGQLIGIDGRKELRAPKKSVILFAHNCKKAGDDAFLLGEKTKDLA